MCRLYEFRCSCSEGSKCSLEALGFQTAISTVLVSCRDKTQTHLKGPAPTDMKTMPCVSSVPTTLIQGDFCSNCLFARPATKAYYLPKKRDLAIGKSIIPYASDFGRIYSDYFQHFLGVISEQNIFRILDPGCRADFAYVFSAIENLVRYIRSKEASAHQNGTSYSYSGGARVIFLWEKLCKIKRFNMVADAEGNSYGAVGPSRPLLLKSVDISKVSDKECSICRDTMTEGYTTENPVQTPCRHIFGYDCIYEWVVKHNNKTCPLCRKRFSTRSHKFPNEEKDSPEWLSILMTDLPPRQK